MRTAGVLLADTPLPDGQFYVTAVPDIGAAAPGSLSLVASIPTLTVVAGTLTPSYNLLDRLVTRFGMQDDAQQLYGMANPVGGSQGANALPTPPAQFTTPYDGTGRPPILSTAFAQNVTSRPKGIRVKSATLFYDVFTNPMTTFTINIFQYQFGTGIVTQIIPVTSVGSLTVGSGKVVTIPVPAANQFFITAQNTTVIMQFNIVNPAGGSMNYYGASIQHDVNYN